MTKKNKVAVFWNTVSKISKFYAIANFPAGHCRYINIVLELKTETVALRTEWRHTWWYYHSIINWAYSIITVARDRVSDSERLLLRKLMLSLQTSNGYNID